MKPSWFSVEPEPDYRRFEAVVRRTGAPDRVPFYELFSQQEGAILERFGVGPGPAPEDPASDEWWDWFLRVRIAAALHLGYDYVVLPALGLAFPTRSPRHVGQSKRHFHQGSDGTIASREDFEAYEWCDPAAANLDLFDKARAHLPEGMGVLVGHSGMLENVMWLLGYENMSYFLYDDEDLVADMFEAVASRIVTAFDRCCAHDTVIGIQMGDDMGYKTATMFAPEVYRTHLFPWYRRLTKAVHDRGKFAILHTCGHVDEVMEDLIGCGWDAKHSFEDLIEPVWETKEKYGDRIALLGGFDMDKLSRMSVPEVRAHTRFLVERCAPGGGWALGSGNSVADYVSVDNYLAMLDEGRRCGGYAASAV